MQNFQDFIERFLKQEVEYLFHHPDIEAYLSDFEARNSQDWKEKWLSLAEIQTFQDIWSEQTKIMIAQMFALIEYEKNLKDVLLSGRSAIFRELWECAEQHCPTFCVEALRLQPERLLVRYRFAQYQDWEIYTDGNPASPLTLPEYIGTLIECYRKDRKRRPDIDYSDHYAKQHLLKLLGDGLCRIKTKAEHEFARAVAIGETGGKIRIVPADEVMVVHGDRIISYQPGLFYNNKLPRPANLSRMELGPNLIRPLAEAVMELRNPGGPAAVFHINHRVNKKTYLIRDDQVGMYLPPGDMLNL